ncbi:MAG: DUF4345 domain-containing protein [Gammaproteobacteria bacterium]|nr:DUF4345 domain-containing protein [Gammaproteobacteria bacterium]
MMILKKGLLIFSFVIVSIIALLYGVSPEWFFQSFLAESHTPGVDQTHILRAVMTLYLTLGLFWLYCAFNNKYRDAGIIIVALFCGGLVAGRVLSLILDGPPSPILMLYIFMELSMVPICIWILRRND